MNVRMQAGIRKIDPPGQMGAWRPRHGIFPRSSINVSVRKANTTSLPVQDCRSAIGLTKNAETTQTRMKSHQHGDEVHADELQDCHRLMSDPKSIISHPKCRGSSLIANLGLRATWWWRKLLSSVSITYLHVTSFSLSGGFVAGVFFGGDRATAAVCGVRIQQEIQILRTNWF